MDGELQLSEREQGGEIKMTQKISPCLWFDDNAEEAAKFYTSIFPNSKIREVVPYNVETPSNKAIGSVMTVSFELDGYSFLGLNGGPYFKPNPSISFHIKCKTIEEVDSYYEKLSENGKILMELNEYPFSKRYAWVEDKFGFSWQIIYTEKDFNQKIVPAFLFTQDICGKAREAIKSYVEIFPESKIDVISEYGKNEFNEKEDNVMYSEFTLVNEEFIAMDSGMKHKFKFSEGISLMIECKDQNEIDYFYEKLSAFPEAEMCGWLKDKFGVSWQLITPNFVKLDKNKKVMEAILKMKRLDLAKLKEAYEGK